MTASHISATKMYGTFTGVFFSFLLAPLQALPNQIISNEVYPMAHLDSTDDHLFMLDPILPKEPPFSMTLQRNMSQVTDLREFIMKYVEDERICQSPSLRNLILGKGESDRAANVWWAKRCGRRATTYKGSSRNLPESTLIRNRRKSSSRSSSQQSPAISAADQKKLTKLLRNKKILCNPKKTVVELPNKDASSLMLKPSCVYIKQCGGCCDSPHLECRPIKIKNRKFKVLALKKDSGKAGALQFSGETLKKVVVEEHTKCQCECKEREEHCSPNQIYDPDACRCYCPTELHRNCPQGKVWDEKQCDCVCSNVSDCTTGRYFDTETCRCADPPR